MKLTKGGDFNEMGSLIVAIEQCSVYIQLSQAFFVVSLKLTFPNFTWHTVDLLVIYKSVLCNIVSRFLFRLY